MQLGQASPSRVEVLSAIEPASDQKQQLKVSKSKQLTASRNQDVIDRGAVDSKNYSSFIEKPQLLQIQPQQQAVQPIIPPSSFDDESSEKEEETGSRVESSAV